MINRNFEWLMVKLASPEDIKSWSKWPVTSPETINYRTWKPKQGWLFCESIFWPIRNFECSCGKYKWVRYKWIVCERCWVEVSSSRVRRERMWHINLASPVVHIWYAKATPSRVWLLLNLSVKEIEKILYFVKYIVVDYDKNQKKNAIAALDKNFEEKLKDLSSYFDEENSELNSQKDSISPKEYNNKKEEIERIYSENKSELEKEYSRIKSILSNLRVWSTVVESDYRNVFYKYDWIFTFESWATAILHLLEKIDLDKEIKDILSTFRKLKWTERDKAFKRLRLLINLHISNVRPEWIVLRHLPVMPPDLRPVVQLEWWRFASSDINLFYRRVLMRNLRLEKMIKAWMPDVIKKNEIRLLQESVNNLIVWEKDTAWKWAWMKVFKSLTDMLSGKEWIFRKNLLWKRVDYSWRSVITVWPNLNLDECWLPIYIAVRMFTPFIISKLIQNNIAHTPKQAEKLIKDENPIALRILKQVIDWKYVMLNRAPTLHRLWIQAFKIRLMPGKTIRLHPLVCPAFNADFDGDQMAVHLPLSDEAQREAREYIASDKNILSPASWDPVITHTQDIVLWSYYLTNDKLSNLEPVWNYNSIEWVVNSFLSWNIDVRDMINFHYNWELKLIMVGRVLFNSILPEEIRFIDKIIWKNELKFILDTVYDNFWREEVVRVADSIKDWWFKFATLSAVTINIFDLVVPHEKKWLLDEWDEKVRQIHDYWYKWFLSDLEKHRLIINVWSEVKTEIERLIKNYYKPWNDVHTLIDSWARWNWSQLTQLSWIKWLIASPSWWIIELPIKSSLIEWFSPIEYFIAAHWARKWKADTALKTAESGYLTRRLVDSSQEVVVKEDDCWTSNWLIITEDDAQLRWEKFENMIYWRTILEDVYSSDWSLIAKEWEILSRYQVNQIISSWLKSLKVRSALTCRTDSWVCKKCYWMDLSKREEVEIGSAIWIIASQSIWEPGTQLTMRTFHGGWVATSEWDMTQGIKRIEELFEIRKPKNSAIVAPFDWTLRVNETWKMLEAEIISEPEMLPYIVKPWYWICVKKWDFLKKWSAFAIKWKSQLKVQQEWEVVDIKDDTVILWVVTKRTKALAGWTVFKVKDGSFVVKWQIISTWALDIKEYKWIVWDLEAQKYIVREIKKVFTSQWQDVNDKYMEIIVKQLFSKVLVEDSWDSTFIPWSTINYEEFIKVNEDLESKWLKPSTWERLALWLTQIAKESKSWMSSASFQETMRIMVDSSTKWAIDELSDLKSNVIIWRLLPIGDIYKKQYNWDQSEINDVSEADNE